KRGRAGISAGSILGSNITDPVFSFGLGGLVTDVTISYQSVRMSVFYMFFVSLFVIGLFYWRRGIDRRAAVLCIFLYIPSSFVL
ncbi:MAG: sodium:calcium antiporter, partial [Halobacteria archaeon]|nr:sodium:calcium antiporter [Halobacteria archaeon]